MNKRWQVFRLFKSHYPDPEHENVWTDISEEMPTADTIVLGKFADNSEEKLFYSKKYPHWLYFHPKDIPQVVTKQLVSWKAIQSPE